MKIAVWHNLPSGGGKRALYHHVKGLVERGHTLESWCPPTADQSYLPLSNLIEEHIIPLEQPQAPKRIKRILTAYQGISDRIQAMDRHCQQCAEEINRRDFDILFANACTFFRTTAIARYVNIPTAIYLGEPYRWLYEAMPQLPWLAPSSLSNSWWQSPKYAKMLLKNLIDTQELRVQAREEVQNAKAFDCILVNSLFSRESVLRAYGIDSKVCYLGIDTNLFQPLDLSKQDYVIGLGGIYPGKGIERAIQAIGTIEGKKPTLVWIGNFSDHYYQSQMEALSYSLGVNFVSKVKISDNEVITLLNQAFAMVYTPILEPFGLAPLEANACGTAVVAIGEGGVRESIQDGVNGFLINGNDPIEMGKAISILFNNKMLATEMGKRSRNHVLERWGMEQSIEKLEQLLLNLKTDNHRKSLAQVLN